MTVDKETHCDRPSKPIEASWAPVDPRGRLYDGEASGIEKSASLLRIVATFHPVLNLPVLLYDFACRVGARRFFTVVGLLICLFHYIFCIEFGRDAGLLTFVKKDC